eukprot:393225-Hanusia_phi.AAC.1
MLTSASASCLAVGADEIAGKYLRHEDSIDRELRWEVGGMAASKCEALLGLRAARTTCTEIRLVSSISRARLAQDGTQEHRHVPA